MRLSIITPYYDTLEETKRLAEVLIPQLTDEIEWIIVSDGSKDIIELKRYIDMLLCTPVVINEKKEITVIHCNENSGGASKPRNVGLDFAKGEYITFIDSDDLVSEDYIETILPKLKTDIIFISWKSEKHNVVVINKPPKWNCSVWSRVYRREIINTRFDESLKIAEDWKFNQEFKYESYTHISKQIYYYNIRKNSLIRSVK